MTRRNRSLLLLPIAFFAVCTGGGESRPEPSLAAPAGTPVAAAVPAGSPVAAAAPAAASPAAAPDAAEIKRLKRAEPGVQMVRLDTGHEVFTQRVGEGPIRLLLLNGGPGVSHLYFDNFRTHLPPAGVQIIFYDQLGSFYSDQPEDPSLWRIDRFVSEVEQVRAALGLDRFCALGNSWGGLLLMEYALAHPERLEAIVISNMVADITEYESYVEGLREALPADVQSRLRAYEQARDWENPGYQELLFTHLYSKHLCRLDPWPAPVLTAFERLGKSVYYAMNGHSEFLIDGNLKGWSRKQDLPRLAMPALLVSARHDTMDPAAMAAMARSMPRARHVLCENGSHLTWWDDEACYFDKLLTFLREVKDGTFRPDPR